MNPETATGGRFLVVLEAPAPSEWASACVDLLRSAGHLVASSAETAEAGESPARGDHEVVVLIASDLTTVARRLVSLREGRLDPVAIVVVGVAAGPASRCLIRAVQDRMVEDPRQGEALGAALAHALRFCRALRRKARFDPAVSDLKRQIGAGELMRPVHEVAARASGSSAPVHLLGEVGSGRQVVARAIHALGKPRRRQGPFIVWPLAAAAPEGTERMRQLLYGTAATPGALELANAGTLVLDEISLLPAALAPGLIDLLAAGRRARVSRADASGEFAVDVRFMAASSADPQAAPAPSGPAVDLQDALGVLSAEVPPLRRRRGDIPIVADTLLNRYATFYDRPVVGLAPAAAALLQAYDWPGNIRELQEHMQRAVRRAHGPALERPDLAELDHMLAGRAAGEAAGTIEISLALNEAMPLMEMNRRCAAVAEIHAIRKALKATGGNITRAAMHLGVSRLHLQKRMTRYGLRRVR
ncbi:MAG: sigma-54-dependent transcriptional regulator [Acidobacteriota bacterium]